MDGKTSAVSMNRSRQLGYGTADLGIAAVESIVQLYLLKFYSEVVGLSAAWVGIALAVAMIWDAISDPLMGGISDRTVHRQGRRRPYFVPGSILLALTFFLLFNPPAAGQSVATFLYLLFSFLLLNTSMTLVAVPHAALAGELSSDRHERSALFGFKRLFATLGALLGLVLPALVLAYWGEPNDPATMARARSVASGLLAPAIIGTAWLSYRLTRGLDRSARERTRWSLDLLAHLVLEQREALKNPLFRLLVFAFIIAAVGRTLNASIALYYYEYFLQLGEQDAVVWVLLPFFLSFIASVPMWIFLAKRWGKKRAALLGVLSLGVTTAVVYPLMPAGQIVFPLAYSLVGGVMAGAIVLMDALVADSIDYDRIRVRRAREGLYFGVWKMSTKVARALGLLLAGVLLDLIGFAEGGGAVSAEVSFRLAFLFGPAVGVLFVTAGVILWFLPLDNALHDRIQRIAQRRWER